MILVLNSRFLPAISTLALTLCLSGCFGKKKTASAAASGPLPLKSPLTPLLSTFVYDEDLTLEPNDPAYDGVVPVGIAGSQYDVFQSLNAPSAWQRQTACDEVIVGVVDSGVDTEHPDLIGNLHDIGSGTPVYGRNFINGTSDVSDQNGHGTHVTGLIAAVGDNSTGVTGVCWSARVLVAKVTSSDGSAFLSDVVDGLEWLLDQDARVLNVSMGSYVPGTTLAEHEQFEDAFAGVISKATSQDAILVAAAGNSGTNANVNRTYPANLSSSRVLAVASNLEGLGSHESLISSSNYGGRTVHISAPGYDLMSTGHVDGDSVYVSKTGTSMAAPMVAGTLALMWDHIGIGGITGRALIDLFLNYSEPHTTGTLGQPGKYLLTGAKLDMGNALEAAANH